MTAPVAAARVTPTGKKMGDGFGVTVTIAADTNIDLFEKSVTPPGVDGGAEIETSDNFHTQWRTKAPRKLMDLTPMTMVCEYDPGVYTQIIAVINVRTTITVTFPDSDTLAFYGFVKSFAPGELTEGTPPTATITIVPTNQDPVACTEAAPVYTASAGTETNC